MKGLLIGLAGPAGSGKDTAADFITEYCKLERYALAQPIKKTVNELFGWDDRHGIGELKEVDDPRLGFSPRKAYQLFGTEFGRALHPEIWIQLAKVRYQELGGLVVTDIRFNNEANWVRSEGGYIVHMERRESLGLDGHASEAGIEFHDDTDWVCPNDGSIRELNESLKEIICEITE